MRRLRGNHGAATSAARQAGQVTFIATDGTFWTLPNKETRRPGLIALDHQSGYQMGPRRLNPIIACYYCLYAPIAEDSQKPGGASSPCHQHKRRPSLAKPERRRASLSECAARSRASVARGSRRGGSGHRGARPGRRRLAEVQVSRAGRSPYCNPEMGTIRSSRRDRRSFSRRAGHGRAGRCRRSICPPPTSSRECSCARHLAPWSS